MLLKIPITNKCYIFELSIHQIIPAKNNITVFTKHNCFQHW